MKFRKSFVTNSSSSSYICEICGEECSGFDMGLYDAEMVECQNGHIFCESHISANALEKVQEDDDWRYELDTYYCPICNFKDFLDTDILRYILKSRKIDLKGLQQEIRANFNSYNQFIEYLKQS